MRVEVLLLFCLSCLALTAQAAPASAQDALLEQKLKQRSDQARKDKTKQAQQSQQHDRHRNKSNHSYDSSSRKAIRGLPQAEARAAQEATHLFPQEHLLSDIQAEVARAETLRRQQIKQLKHEMQVEDSIHIARTGRSPAKFPVITVSP